MSSQSVSTRPNTASARPEARLTSWKEIAQFFDRDVRTVKRWEKSRHLPVHRLPGVRGGVYAFVHELQEWQAHPEPEDLIDDPEAEDSDSADTKPAAESTRSGVLTLVPRDARSTWPAQDTGPRTAPQPEFPAAATYSRSASSWAEDRSAGPRRVPWIPATAIAVLVVCAALGGWLYLRKGGLRHVPSPEARELYLKGRYYWDKRTPDDLNNARGYFQQAIAKDPTYGAAYASLADTYYLLREFGTLPDSRAFPDAIAASKKALSLEPNLAQAHRSYAFASFYWTWDRPLAESEFRKAIQLDPEDALSHHWFANALQESGRYPEAMTEMNRARDLEPTSKALLADRALLLIVMGRDQEAAEDLKNMERDDPSFVAPHRYLGGYYLDHHQNSAFVTEMQTVAQQTHAPADVEIADAATKAWATGDEARLRNALAETQVDLYRKGQTGAYEVAVTLARVGQDEQALRYLELSYANHDSEFLMLGRQSDFSRFRNSPEFMELVQRSHEPYKQLTPAAKDPGAMPPH